MKKLPPKATFNARLFAVQEIEPVQATFPVAKAPVYLNQEQLQQAENFFNMQSNPGIGDNSGPQKYSRKNSNLPYSLWKIKNPETDKFDFYVALGGKKNNNREYGFLGRGGSGRVKKLMKVYNGETNKLLTQEDAKEYIVIKIHDNDIKDQQHGKDQQLSPAAANEIRYLEELNKHIMSGQIRNTKGKLKVVSFMPMFVGQSLFDIIYDKNINEIDKLKIIIAVLKKLKSEFHDSNLVHGDFQSDNVIINLKYNDVYIIDFGFTGKKGTVPTKILNGSKWASKAQRAGAPLDPKMDIYSLFKSISLQLQRVDSNNLVTRAIQGITKKGILNEISDIDNIINEIQNIINNETSIEAKVREEREEKEKREERLRQQLIEYQKLKEQKEKKLIEYQKLTQQRVREKRINDQKLTEQRARDLKNTNKVTARPLMGLNLQLSKEKLLNAAKNGDLEVVNALIEKGADINLANKDGYTALILAAKYGHLGVVNALIEKGADINLVNEFGNTALMLAAKEGRFEVVIELLKIDGIKLNQKNSSFENNTALMLAAEKGHLNVVQALIEKGADINLVNEFGNTALVHAAKNNHIAVFKFLLPKLNYEILLQLYHQDEASGLTLSENFQKLISQYISPIFCAIEDFKDKIQQIKKQINSGTVETLNSLDIESLKKEREKLLSSHPGVIIDNIDDLDEQKLQAIARIKKQDKEQGNDVQNNEQGNDAKRDISLLIQRKNELETQIYSKNQHEEVELQKLLNKTAILENDISIQILRYRMKYTVTLKITLTQLACLLEEVQTLQKKLTTELNEVNLTRGLLMDLESQKLESQKLKPPNVESPPPLKKREPKKKRR